MATKRLWRWRGIDVQGAPCQGMLWQTKRLEDLQHLQQQRVIPLAVRRCAVKQSLWHPRYSCETIRQLATLLQAGLPLAEGLSLLAQQQSHAQWQALLEAPRTGPGRSLLCRTGAVAAGFSATVSGDD